MVLEVSKKERALLLGVLEETLSKLSMEVRRTTIPEHRDPMADDERRLVQLLARVRKLRRRPFPPK